MLQRATESVVLIVLHDAGKQQGVECIHSAPLSAGATEIAPAAAPRRQIDNCEETDDNNKASNNDWKQNTTKGRVNQKHGDKSGNC